MDKKRAEAAAAVVAVALFLFAAAGLLRPRPQAPAAQAGAVSAESRILEDAQFVGTVRSTEETLEQQSGRWDQEWERDPFQLQEAASAGGVENLALKGIFWDDQNPRAVVNHKTLRLGDTVDGYKVMEIRPDSVVLWTGEKNLELRLFRSPENAAPAGS